MKEKQNDLLINSYNMETKYFTWQDLYDHIATMSEDERKSPALIISEDESSSDAISIKKDNEDLVWDADHPEAGLYLRSEWEEEYGCEFDPDIVVFANTTYLYIYKR